VNQANSLWLIVFDMHLSAGCGPGVAGCGPDAAGCGPDVAGCGPDVDQEKGLIQISKELKIK